MGAGSLAGMRMNTFKEGETVSVCVCVVTSSSTRAPAAVRPRAPRCMTAIRRRSLGAARRPLAVARRPRVGRDPGWAPRPRRAARASRRRRALPAGARWPARSYPASSDDRAPAVYTR